MFCTRKTFSNTRLKNEIKSNGFSLIEMLMVLAIISILTLISLPLYSHYFLQAKQLDAKIALEKLASLLEEHYTLNNTYEDATLDNLGMNEYTEGKAYQLVIFEKNDIDFMIEAIPFIKDTQKDTQCGTFSLNSKEEKGISGTGTINECW